MLGMECGTQNDHFDRIKAENAMWNPKQSFGLKEGWERNVDPETIGWREV